MGIAKGAKGKGDLQNLVVVLAKLTMVNTRELASLMGTVYHTFCLSEKHFIAEAAKEGWGALQHNGGGPQA